MAEPRIQYTQTTDGVNIAYRTMGEGTPFIHVSVVLGSHIEAEMQFPEFRAWHERMSRKRMLVRYDSRGCGLSDRENTEASLDAYLRDLEAVVDDLGLQSFALFAPGPAGPIAIAYAARHPHRVSHLILWLASARLSVAMRDPRFQALLGLLDTDWELFTETLAHSIQGWSEGEPARRVADLFRQSVSQDVTRAVLEALEDFDVDDLLPLVQSPTLVLHRRNYPMLGVGDARSLSAGIPNAQLTILDGSAFAWYLQDCESVAGAIDEFLGDGVETEAKPEPVEPGAFRTVLFTDMEGSTSLTQQVGDAKAQDVLHVHNAIVRDALKAHSGTETKHTGDGIMASFASASRALECAIDIQRGFAQHSESNPDTPIRVRIGLNAGEPVAEEEDLFGTAVQLAARVCDRAEPGQILASNVVQELAAGKGFTFVDNGEATLKGFDKPVRLHEVRWHD